MFQTVVEYALSLLSTLREKETLMASLWKYLKFSIKKFYQTMVFRVQFATLVAIRLKHHGNVIVARRWQAPKKMVCLSKQQLKRLRSFPNPIGNCPKTSLLPTMVSSFCSDFNSLTGNTAKLSLGAYWMSSMNLMFSVILALLWKTLLLCKGEILARTESYVSVTASCSTYLRGPCDEIPVIPAKVFSIISGKIFADNLIDFSYTVCWDWNFSPRAKLRRTAQTKKASNWASCTYPC